MTETNEIEKEFEEMERNDEWEDAFKNINSIAIDSNVKLTFTHAKHSSNERYNRYRNILPYDHSRIKLKEMSDTDYINANLVESKLIDRKYILTQGPLKNTCEHFWQMVWEQNTKGIIMLNKLYEKGFLKCEMYFPNVDEDNGETTLKFGKFNLHYISEKPFEDFSIRTIECENLEQKETREIYHFHFTNWPDFGEPEHTASFLKFLNECKNLNIFNLNDYGPPIVHCSAGVGRSGTFILVDSMIELYRLHGDQIPMRVSNYLADLRSYRMGLVQTHQQFKFAFQAIVDHINQVRFEKKQKIIYDQSPVLLEDNANKSSSNEKSSESDEFSNDDDVDDNEETNTRRRPGTALTNKKDSKRFKLSEEKINKIKKLRYLQQKNKTSDLNEEEFSDIATAKPTKYTNGETKNDLSSSDNLSNEEDEDETKPFAKSTRNCQTVRVNQARQPLDLALLNQNENSNNNNENELIETKTDSYENNLPQASNLSDINNGNFQTNNIYQRNVQSTSNENNFQTSNTAPRARCLSDKEKRIAEQVNKMKQNLIKHEQHKKLMTQLKPLLIGGSILLGGYILFQLYKKIF